MRCTCEFSDNQLPFRSPFGRLLATNYYDGPVAGILECNSCKTLFHFEKLDWDDGQDMRIFAVAHIPSRGFQEVDDFSSTSRSTREWILDAARDIDIISIVDGMIADAMSPHLVVATTNLLGILASCRIIDRIDDTDWFHEFNLSRKRID